LKVLDHLRIDALIPIGGDDTLSYGLRLHQEGVPVIAIPKTMDNDVHGTDYCIGFSTAVTRSVQFIHQLRTSAGLPRAASPSSSCSAATRARRP
jgi:ATP-dependent phosphofructokinase / diphosphate-dependent phosphofructokinase